MTVKLTGHDRLHGMGDHIVTPVVTETPAKVAEFGAQSARRGVPRATSRTASSIAARASGRDGATLRVGGAGRFIEFGTRRMRARRFMLRAFHDMRDHATELLLKEAKNAERKWSS